MSDNLVTADLRTHTDPDLDDKVEALQLYARELNSRIRKLEARLQQTQQWRDHYRHMWLGGSVTEVEIPMTDAELTALLDKQD